jgi:hypothetical protein
LNKKGGLKGEGRIIGHKEVEKEKRRKKEGKEGKRDREERRRTRR